jgi:hypothetical protein
MVVNKGPQSKSGLMATTENNRKKRRELSESV